MQIADDAGGPDHGVSSTVWKRPPAAAHQDIREFIGAVEFIIHGTTLATNALLTGRGAKLGMLTTDGFRDELEIRRGFKNIRTSMYQLGVPPVQTAGAAPFAPARLRAHAVLGRNRDAGRRRQRAPRRWTHSRRRASRPSPSASCIPMPIRRTSGRPSRSAAERFGDTVLCRRFARDPAGLRRIRAVQHDGRQRLHRPDRLRLSAFARTPAGRDGLQRPSDDGPLRRPGAVGGSFAPSGGDLDQLRPGGGADGGRISSAGCWIVTT